VQPHHLGQILGVQQLFRIVQRGLNILFSVGNGPGADVLGTGANGRTLALDPGSGLLRAGDEILERLAGWSKLASAIDRISLGISKRSVTSTFIMSLLSRSQGFSALVPRTPASSYRPITSPV
jgi:hypothetical protein